MYVEYDIDMQMSGRQILSQIPIARFETAQVLLFGSGELGDSVICVAIVEYAHVMICTRVVEIVTNISIFKSS